MADDDLDALLTGALQGRRSRGAGISPGLRVSDILTMPEEQQTVVNWLIRHYEATPADLADQIDQTLAQVQTHLDELLGLGYVYTVDRDGRHYYRVKLAPKSGRQMPTDVWQVLDRNSERANVFISYSRHNKEFVQQLHSALEATGREVWVDWESIPVAGDWWQEIQLGIELADTFLFVLSPDSVASKVCGQEIEEALKHNKRLVPVVFEEVPPEQVHPELARLNWIFLRPGDNFQQGFQRLLAALDQDLDYVRAHTRLLVRALDWERHGRDSSYLLRGADLARANEHLAQGNDQEPHPTDLHHRYVQASAEAESSLRAGELERQAAVLAEQRRWLRVVTVISVVAVGMGILSGTLLHRTQQAQARAELGQWQALQQLAQVLGQSHQHFDALLAATQAGQVLQRLPQTMQTPDRQAQTGNTLQRALAEVRERNRLMGHQGQVTQVAFSADGSSLASVSTDGSLRLWGLDGRTLATFRDQGAPLRALALSPDGERLAATDAQGQVYGWRRDGTLEQRWVAHHQALLALAMAPDGQTLATASRDGTLTLWTWQGQPLKQIPGLGGLWQTIAWSANGQLLAGDDQGNLRRWSQDGTPLPSLPQQSSGVTALAASPDGTALVVANREGQVQRYDLATGESLDLFVAQGELIHVLQALPDDQGVITGGDRGVRLWRWDGRSWADLHAPTDPVVALAVDPMGTLVATTGEAPIIRLWALPQDEVGAVLKPYDDQADLPALLKSSCTWLADYLAHQPAAQESPNRPCS